jgi:hypothetical protein
MPLLVSERPMTVAQWIVVILPLPVPLPMTVAQWIVVILPLPVPLPMTVAQWIVVILPLPVPLIVVSRARDLSEGRLVAPYLVVRTNRFE